MLTYKPKIIKNFSGRNFEANLLRDIASKKTSEIVAVYGRRRVGKTALIEQSFANRNLLKFEGTEGKPEHFQKTVFLKTLAKYTRDSSIANKSSDLSWIQIFELLAKYVKKDTWTIYLEELQWLADYKPDLISELKPVWDNQLRQNPNLILILCGSSPSFFLSHVIRSKSLYNRSLSTIKLEQLAVKSCQQMLNNRSLADTFNAYLTVGGIPEYLKKLSPHSSTYLGVCKESFSDDAFFFQEFEKIFVSSFGKTKLYRDIVKYLGSVPWATRDQILKAVNNESNGGITERLEDLEQCGFIQKNLPVDADLNTKGARYEIKDAYLAFYFRHILPNQSKITRGNARNKSEVLLPLTRYSQSLGYAFERYCRDKSQLIAEKLGFGGVEYSFGSYYLRRRKTSIKTLHLQAQVDLIFKRKDKVWTVCEIKYSDEPATRSVIPEFLKKIEILEVPKKVTVQRVLISANGASDSLLKEPFFDKILTLEDLV